MYCNADGPALELLLVPEAAAWEAALASAAAARSNIDERSSGGAGAAGFAFAATGATGVEAVTSIASKFGIAPWSLRVSRLTSAYCNCRMTTLHFLNDNSSYNYNLAKYNHN